MPRYALLGLQANSAALRQVEFSVDICPRLSISGIWCVILSVLCSFHRPVHNYLHPVRDTQLLLLAHLQIVANYRPVHIGIMKTPVDLLTKKITCPCFNLHL